MGRGRAKAKQTKVARELKYHSPNTDLAALQRELGGSGKSDHDFDDDYKELSTTMTRTTTRTTARTTGRLQPADLRGSH